MPFVIPEINLAPLYPALVTGLTAIVIMLADIVLPGRGRGWFAAIALAGLALAEFSALSIWGQDQTGFNNTVVADNFALALSIIILISTFVVILLSTDFVRRRELEFGEYLALLLAAAAGMILMAIANDLIIIFLGLELFSLPLYVLAGFWRKNSLSLEAGYKYFILGAFSSAFFLYGIAFVYGATGTTLLPGIASALSQAGAGQNTMFLMALALLVVGFGFKVALVPFQWWTPDVYEGAPTPVTAFMSVATKAAAFAAFFRVFATSIPPEGFDWQGILALLAVLTMTAGNIAALIQTNIKRMLAYSSIAHAGYILIALVANTAEGASAAVYYLLAYAATNLGAFGAVLALERGTNDQLEMKDLAGAAQIKPWAAAALSVCLISLAGFPPLAGFVGKFLVFSSAVNSGFTWLAVLGVLNSLVSVYYYLGPVIRMYMQPPAEGWERIRTPLGVTIAVVIAVVGTIALGIFPLTAIDLAQAAALK